MATAVPTRAPVKHRHADREDPRPPPAVRMGVRRAPQELCFALVSLSDQRVGLVEKWLEDTYPDRLPTKAAVSSAAAWVISEKNIILAGALEDRAKLRLRVQEFDNRVSAAIDKSKAATGVSWIQLRTNEADVEREAPCSRGRMRSLPRVLTQKRTTWDAEKQILRLP